MQVLQLGFLQNNAESIKLQADLHSVGQIKAQIEASTSEFDTEKLQERLAKLAGGVAVIKVGAATEAEMKEKKLRIEDALNATRAAVEDGIVPGGGVAILNVIPEVKKLLATTNGDEKVGVAIVLRALEEPARQIAENAGFEGSVAGGGVALLNAVPAVAALLESTEDADEKTGVRIVLKALEEPVRQIAANAGLEGSVIVNEIVSSDKVGYGYNFADDTYCDMAAAGILDPKKVTRSALQNAASVAAMVLTTESLVTDKPDPAADAAQAAAMAAQGGGMY